MRIITERKLRKFWQDETGAEAGRREKVMREWINIVRRADWANFSRLKQTFNRSLKV